MLILFLCFGIVSGFVTRSQLNMYMEKSAREFQTISQTIFRDIAMSDKNNLSTLVAGYAAFYRRNNITIDLVELESAHENILVSFVERSPKYFINVTGQLPEPFEFYKLVYDLDITEQIAEMRTIQRTLLFICVVFSVLTGFALYFIINRLFKPLGLVSKTSRQIADGHYAERIRVKGSNDIFAMVDDFNRMAEKIESEITGKQRFIDNFAHEIRTPITSIYGNAEYMQKALLDEDENIKLTQAIMDKTNHIKQISDSLLQLATLRNYSPVTNQINLSRLFDDIAQTLHKPIHEKKIRFVYESDAEFLNGQEDLIKSLLLNLCLNSFKACSPNIGVVSLKAEKNGDSIVISVTDNGSGISKESIEKVTEPFYRVDESRNRNYGGAGLGLTLCKQIAEVHGAEMTIESTEGIGTAIKIKFTTP
jgi:signal transduction histidine kinase